MTNLSNTKRPPNATALILLSDGTIFWGHGIGAENDTVGEICFNTSITGYQEILTDPSYAGQIITFTFPHIGNVGTNSEDIETTTPYAKGLIIREEITSSSNWRANANFDEWLKSHNLVGICGIDTRALTRYIRDHGAPIGLISHNKKGEFDLEKLLQKAKSWSGLKGLDLAKEVSCTQRYDWTETLWNRESGYGEQTTPEYKVVAIDFGAKRNILRCLAASGCDVTVVPAQTSAEDIIALQPDGVFLSNGPGDPAATGKYAVPTVKALIDKNMPIFGICLGHQILAQALGCKTRKMHLGHRGANQPVKDLKTNRVEITSQNHGFEVIADDLPEGVEQTHISLFDGSNEGIALTGKPVFSVQYHPEASPGPQDSHHLFDRFVNNIAQTKNK